MTAPSAAFVTGAISLGLMLGQLPIMVVPALSVELAALWHLSASEIGWLGGIYFAGYAVALPFLTGAANRMDGRIVYAAAALTGAAASFAFALFAQGFWGALVLRFLAGIGFAGIHIIGMKLLSDRLTGRAQTRASAVYTGAFAVGSGLSYLLTGQLAAQLGWEAAFVAAGFGAVTAVATLLFVGPPLEGDDARSKRLFPDFRAALREPEIVRYVVAYAGNLWEVYAIRVWFVPFLAFNAALNSDTTHGWSPATVASISVFVSVPFNLAIAEMGVRWGHRGVIFAVSAASVAVCGVLGWQASGPYLFVLALLLIHGITSYGDVGSIAGGVVAASTPETRAAALALFGLIGSTFGFIGPLAVGLAIDLGGGRDQADAWLWAAAVMALDSVVSALAMLGRRATPSAES